MKWTSYKTLWNRSSSNNNKPELHTHYRENTFFSSLLFSFSIMKTTLLHIPFFVFRWLRLLFMCVCIFFLFSPHLYFKHLKQKKKKRKKNFEKKKQQQKNTYTSIWVPGSFLMCNKVKVSVCN